MSIYHTLQSFSSYFFPYIYEHFNYVSVNFTCQKSLFICLFMGSVPEFCNLIVSVVPSLSFHVTIPNRLTNENDVCNFNFMKTCK